MTPDEHLKLHCLPPSPQRRRERRWEQAIIWVRRATAIITLANAVVTPVILVITG